jgi:hypothetical protein
VDNLLFLCESGYVFTRLKSIGSKFFGITPPNCH